MVPLTADNAADYLRARGWVAPGPALGVSPLRRRDRLRPTAHRPVLPPGARAPAGGRPGRHRADRFDGGRPEMGALPRRLQPEKPAGPRRRVHPGRLRDGPLGRPDLRPGVPPQSPALEGGPPAAPAGGLLRADAGL